ncbi:MAG: PleD family two-component system response regulator [Acidimicrobiia bacterium]
MHILVATDAAWVLDELRAALEGPDVTFSICTDGRDVAGFVRAHQPDVAVLDLQVGTMGGMATTMQLRLDESSGLLPRVPIVMLLDRSADIHLARRSSADGWLIKPLDALRIRRAVTTVAGGGTFHEGVPVAAPTEAADAAVEDTAASADAAADSPTGEPATTG